MKTGLTSDLCAERLKALADKERLRIVEVLRGGGRNVSQIARDVGAEMANVSHHLRILKQTGIVRSKRQGRFIVYSLHPQVFSPESAAREQLDLGCCKLELPAGD
ncbi:MAG TPA: metalloregulator ArsR/SmtB family transcription factor [Pirellulaceae bacterium]|jgi:ArsR family transcriptional regulator, nickel/cobalt-responsive transcriptional repressor|nr:metalloregulator ArsR/SmtB family transcription factor [Pirellulaceae bacterium]